MDEVLNVQFDRVDTALSTLVESIATYNPSVQAHVDLIAADDELALGLEELEQHQANFARILALRAEAEALEAQLRSTISTLASLRTELLENPIAEEPPNSHPVSAQDVLNYAAKIARYTVPPMYRDHVTEEKKKDEAPSSTVPTTAVGTPAVAETTELPKDTEAQAAAADQPPPSTEPDYLRKGREMGLFWTPWPDDDRIRKGNLMAIQRLLDQGKDPWTDKVLTAAEMEAAAQREKNQQEEHERKKREREDQARAQYEERERQRQQAQAVQQQQGGEGAPQQQGQAQAPVAQFGGFDFDDDDED